MVFGFFADGEAAQNPIVFGVFPKIPLNAGKSEEAFNDPRSGDQLTSAPVKPGETATVYPRKLDEPTTSRLARNDTDYPSEINTSKANKKESKARLFFLYLSSNKTRRFIFGLFSTTGAVKGYIK
jgi:hypothetical protein